MASLSDHLHAITEQITCYSDSYRWPVPERHQRHLIHSCIQHAICCIITGTSEPPPIILFFLDHALLTSQDGQPVTFSATLSSHPDLLIQYLGDNMRFARPGLLCPAFRIHPPPHLHSESTAHGLPHLVCCGQISNDKGKQVRRHWRCWSIDVLGHAFPETSGQMKLMRVGQRHQTRRCPQSQLEDGLRKIESLQTWLSHMRSKHRDDIR